MPRNPYWTAQDAAKIQPLLKIAHDKVFAPSVYDFYENDVQGEAGMTGAVVYRIYMRTDASYWLGAKGDYSTSISIYDSEGYLYDTGISSQYNKTVDKAGYYYVSISWRYVPAGTPGTVGWTFAEDFGDDGKDTGSPPSTTVSVAWANILRTPGDATLLSLKAQTDAHVVSAPQGVDQIIKMAGATTSVATLSYQFFTGKIPGLAGIDYLVDPKGANPNNLNSAYYQSFNLENRYINFAVNLGKLGEGKATFAAKYGSLDLFDATREAYKTIFGGTPTDAKIHALIDTRADYFASYGGDGANGIGTKAAMVGWLLAEAVKADVGMYAKVNDVFLVDLADGATFAVDLVGVYGRAVYEYAG
ncbi:hypothetical protein [Caulobacter sp. 1776]|uniref:hypothetical protein n=1 Tax=Caulobacter sp. 1776 TaxID=3156420 RepID=UPI003399094F